LLAFLIAAFCVTLAGCASTKIISEVTAFHEWPVELRNRSFTFERTKEQENNLEHRSYEGLVRAELLRLGFTEAEPPQSAALKVGMQYAMTASDMRVVEPVYAGGPFYGPPWGPFFSPWGYPGFYDPFWYGPTYMADRRYEVFTRHLKITISRASDSKRLWEVTVLSQGTNGSLPAVMPYMVRSAFADFPGPNGVPRRIELKMKE
jgi:hypothetical protein